MENALNSAGVLLADRQSRQSHGAPSYGGPSSVGKSSVLMFLQGKCAVRVDNDSSDITRPLLPMIRPGQHQR